MKRSPIVRRTPLRSRVRPRERRTRPERQKPSRGIPEAVRSEIRSRSAGVCEHCREHEATEMHHRLPRSRGGPDDTLNLIHLCRDCHHIEAHQNYHPDLMTAGFMLHGKYTGSNREYQRRYNERAPGEGKRNLGGTYGQHTISQ